MLFHVPPRGLPASGVVVCVTSPVPAAEFHALLPPASLCGPPASLQGLGHFSNVAVPSSFPARLGPPQLPPQHWLVTLVLILCWLRVYPFCLGLSMALALLAS